MSQLTGSKTAIKEDTILRINNLHTYFYTDIGVSKALNGVTLDIPARKVMGVVGESGCGKSVTALSCMRLLPRSAKIIKGDITLFRKPSKSNGHGMIVDEVKLTDLNPMSQEIRDIRGDELAMIFQEPMTSLNPSYTVGDQIAEAIILHQKVDDAEAETRTITYPRPGGHGQRQGHFQALPARTERRHAPARHDRHGAVLQPGRAVCR